MTRMSLILSLFAVGCFIATATLMPGLGTAQTDKVEAAMATLMKNTQKLGAPKVAGKDLYFGTTKVDSSVVDAVAKEHGGDVTLFVKTGDEYVRVATTLKREDGASAVGTALEAASPAFAKLNKGEGYYGRNETVFGKLYVALYEPIKDASGAVIGAYFAGQQQELREGARGAMGKFMLTTMASVAELEAGLISERTKAALKAAKARGVKLGRHGAEVLAPRFKEEARQRAMELEPVITELKAQGLSLARIAVELNKRKVATPRGGKWDHSSVGNVLQRLAA